MTVARLSKSGNQAQIVTDEGKIYGCSKGLIDGLIKGKIKLVLFSRMPFDISPDRFGLSPLWDGEKLINQEGNVIKEFTTRKGDFSLVDTSNDGLSVSRLRQEDDKSRYVDKEVEFD